MKLAQLKSLVKKGESETLEFKKTTANLSSGMATVCAFLNSDHGGMLIFGVKDDGQLVGQIVTDKTLKDIAADLKKIEPHPKIDVKYIPVAGERQAILFTVNPSENAPYTYDGRFYARNQSTTERMTKEEHVYLHNKNNPALWESLTNNACRLIDLDRNRIKEVVRMAVEVGRLPENAISATIPDILKKFKLIVNEKITNAAVILFCKNEDKQFFQSNIKLARFNGVDKTSFIDAKTFTGNAFDLYDKSMVFLSSNLPIAARIEEGNSNRIENPAIPFKVLREALTNALVHRDYSHAGGSVAVAIYDDRINITNIGSLPKGVQLNQLSKEHPSIKRNPLIAHVFYLCGKIEGWGRGTLDMIQDCKKAGNPPPKYEEIGGSFSLTLTFKEPLRAIITKEPKKINLKLTDRQKEIVHILQEGPLKIPQIKELMSKVLTDRIMQVELAKLKAMGLIESKGKTKATTWYLTE